jgi:hypothetical protein
VGLTCAFPTHFVIFPSSAKIVSQLMSGSHNYKATEAGGCRRLRQPCAANVSLS